MKIEELLTTLRKEESNHGPHHIEVAKVLNNLGNAYGCLAKKLCDIQEAKYNLQKAKESLERALVIEERYYGSDHIEVAETLHNLGNCFLILYAYYGLEEYQKAKELLERALVIKERYYPFGHVEVAKTLHKLGNAYYGLKDYHKAKELYEKALATRKRYYFYDRIEVARLLNNLGGVAHALEDYHKAKEYYERALAILERHYSSDRIEVAETSNKLGNAYYNLEDYHKAKELYERVLPIFERHYGTDHAKVDIILTNLNKVCDVLEKQLSGNASKVTDQLASGIHNISLKATSLHIAARDGELEAVKYFVSKGAGVNDTDKYGWTPLHYAVWERQLGAAKFLLDKGANINMKNVLLGGRSIDVTRKSHSFIAELRSYHEQSGHEQSGSVIQLAHSHKEQQKAFSRLFKLTSRYHNDTDIKQVEQALYLSAFKKRNVKVNGKCSSITRAFSQILFLGLDLNKSDLHELFLHNLKTSAELYERIAQGKQISKREEREIFALSKLLDTFEQQLDSLTSSLPSNLTRIKNYKTLDELSSYVNSLTDDFAIHLIIDNHVVAIYKIGDTYSYFDTNVAFVSGLKSVDQLMKVVEKAVKCAGYKLGENGFLVEHFDVNKANSLLSDEDKQVLTKEIKTERQLLAEQDKELGPIKINGQELSRVQLYDFGTKVNVEGSVPLLINADMNLNSEDFLGYLNAGKVNITAREHKEYLDNLGGDKVKEVIQATKIIPFIGSKREIKDAEQITNSIEKSQNNQKEKLPKFLAVLLGKLNKEPTDLLSDNPATCFNDVLVNNKFEYRSAHRM